MFWKYLTTQKYVHEIKNIGYLLSIQETKRFNMSYNRCNVVNNVNFKLHEKFGKNY